MRQSNSSTVKLTNTDLAFSEALRGYNITTAISLIDNGLNCNAKDMFGNTPLHWAAQAGFLKVVEELIKAGANIEQQNCNNNTAYDFAVQAGYNEIAKLLIKPLVTKTMASLLSKNKYNPEVFTNYFLPFLDPKHILTQDDIKNIRNTLPNPVQQAKTFQELVSEHNIKPHVIIFK